MSKTRIEHEGENFFLIHYMQLTVLKSYTTLQLHLILHCIQLKYILAKNETYIVLLVFRVPDTRRLNTFVILKS